MICDDISCFQDSLETIQKLTEENETLKEAIKEILDFKSIRLNINDWNKYRELIK